MTTIQAWSFRLLALLLVLLMQGPAMFVQEMAWGKMLINYTQERGLARGLVETFDGKHPCELCDAAADLRKKPDTPTKPVAKRPGHCWAQMTMVAKCQLPQPTTRQLLPDLPRADIFSKGIGAFAPALPPPLAA